jgi:hypothetical protein
VSQLHLMDVYTAKISRLVIEMKERAVMRHLPSYIAPDEVKWYADKHNIHFEQPCTMDSVEWLSVDGVRTDEIAVVTKEFPLRLVVEWRQLTP